jgi:hypothetical protein
MVMTTMAQQHILQQQQEMLRSTGYEAAGIHQKTPFCVGSRREMEALMAAVGK